MDCWNGEYDWNPSYIYAVIGEEVFLPAGWAER